ncbi:MAG: bifunctional proline dehydrogenase/L-glutamate gamma-semialdehyde dehydrogenase PutA [Pseudomonadota bacterium]
MTTLAAIRQQIRLDHLRDEAELLSDLDFVSEEARTRAAKRAAGLVRDIRADSAPGLMEVFLAEYGLSTDEGIALMCLAEALLRVPDADTVDALIEDKIAPSHWGAHLGKSSSPLVNASTWALLLTGKVLQDGTGVASVLKDAVRRLGEPVIRTAVGRAMRELGQQFVLGQTIEEALKRGRGAAEAGYTFSYDMLGEAAMTASDAESYYAAYADAIAQLGQEATSAIRDNPGISIKLSALHPRYEEGQKDRVMAELVPRVLDLARAAKAGGLGLNIDAEEADRLDISLDVIEAVLCHPSLADWDGFGIVVQAYGKRAGGVIDWFYALASELDRRVMLRLVKGAYWDTEIKRAQVDGLQGFPVWTRKAATDVAYLSLAERLFGLTDRIYPQFATHNAHSVAAILELGADPSCYEFQRLHGMGAALHDRVMAAEGTRCRIYAPVGAHRDLLAYLVRRLLENGANSSFVHQILDAEVPPEVVAADPHLALGHAAPVVAKPEALYAPERVNSHGWNLHDRSDLAEIETARAPFLESHWAAGPMLDGPVEKTSGVAVRHPANPDQVIGEVHDATQTDIETALAAARVWDAGPEERAEILTKASDLYEAQFGELFAILAREAGKTPADAIAELREAVDFLRYYAARGREIEAPPRGIVACISPWNFPLAIFTGQIAAALAAGNGVIAKPAEATILTAALATGLMHKAGVPTYALQLLPGAGATVGARLSSDERIAQVCFTGSTTTAHAINRSMAETLDPTAPLIAETGGLNAMVVDSTALPEQAVRDIVASAFQSAGQRCSALRLLYVQEDIADNLTKMLSGAMDELRLGDPWDAATDVGPVIDAGAKASIDAHIAKAQAEGRVLKQLMPPEGNGHFVGPAIIRLPGIAALEREVFGPVLHLATYKAADLGRVIQDINDRGFGLTFGVHSRIDDRVDLLVQSVKTGNLYVNRNQIGAIVGSQPFGGEGLSGTGPKAGGPAYVARFTRPGRVRATPANADPVDPTEVQAVIDAAGRPADIALSTVSLPGPTGESNRLSTHPRGVILCLGPTPAFASRQARLARGAGCIAIEVAPGASGRRSVDGHLERSALTKLSGIDAVALWSTEDDLRAARRALAARDGPIVPLLAEDDLEDRCILERHVCVDTTAAGGNAQLLAEAG